MPHPPQLIDEILTDLIDTHEIEPLLYLPSISMDTFMGDYFFYDSMPGRVSLIVYRQSAGRYHTFVYDKIGQSWSQRQAPQHLISIQAWLDKLGEPPQSKEIFSKLGLIDLLVDG